MMDGRECHLVGLRDFTDLKSLAGENATDAIQEESMAASVVASASASERVDAFDVFSEPSYEPRGPGSDASESVSNASNASNATLQRTERENGIVEKRLKYFGPMGLGRDINLAFSVKMLTPKREKKLKTT